MNILGLKIIAHDTGAALISDDRVIAIAEERLNRVKHSRGMFPVLAIDYCLREFNLNPSDIDYIVIDQVGSRDLIDVSSIFRAWDKENKFANAKLEVINHQAAHAASAFLCSPFEEAAVLVYDGSGEQFKTHLGVSADETESYYRGLSNSVDLLHKTVHTRLSNRRFPFTFGGGKLYSFLSAHYINFGKYSEGKMMGLAAYGDDHILKKIPIERWFKQHNDHLVCNAQIGFPNSSVLYDLKKRKIWRLKNFFIVFNILKKEWLRFCRHFSKYVFLKFNPKYDTLIADPKIFEPIQLERGIRDKNVKLPDEYYSSVAYAGQKILEAFAVECGKKLRSLVNSENICIAGGVGLNIDANKHFINKVGFKNIFIQPACSDTGIALGCALYGVHILAKQPRRWQMKSASLGRQYTNHEIEADLENVKEQIKIVKSDKIFEDVARLIAGGKIIGWFSGGSEYGPRALGNRSIICDARIPDMKDVLNEKVKHRESWRPFATSMLAQYVEDWFELSIPSPFMLFEGKIKKEHAGEIPSVIHVDNTSRIQAVTLESNERYYKLIEAFHRLTGVPLILNTSFNLAGEPIVETPADALNTFLKTKMDYLILEDYIVSKK